MISPGSKIKLWSLQFCNPSSSEPPAEPPASPTHVGLGEAVAYAIQSPSATGFHFVFDELGGGDQPTTPTENKPQVFGVSYNSKGAMTPVGYDLGPPRQSGDPDSPRQSRNPVSPRPVSNIDMDLAIFRPMPAHSYQNLKPSEGTDEGNEFYADVAANDSSYLFQEPFSLSRSSSQKGLSINRANFTLVRERGGSSGDPPDNLSTDDNLGLLEDNGFENQEITISVKSPYLFKFSVGNRNFTKSDENQFQVVVVTHIAENDTIIDGGTKTDPSIFRDETELQNCSDHNFILEPGDIIYKLNTAEEAVTDEQEKLSIINTCIKFENTKISILNAAGKIQNYALAENQLNNEARELQDLGKLNQPHKFKFNVLKHEGYKDTDDHTSVFEKHQGNYPGAEEDLLNNCCFIIKKISRKKYKLLIVGVRYNSIIFQPEIHCGIVDNFSSFEGLPNNTQQTLELLFDNNYLLLDSIHLETVKKKIKNKINIFYIIRKPDGIINITDDNNIYFEIIDDLEKAYGISIRTTKKRTGELIPEAARRQLDQEARERMPVGQAGAMGGGGYRIQEGGAYNSTEVQGGLYDYASSNDFQELSPFFDNKMEQLVKKDGYSNIKFNILLLIIKKFIRGQNLQASVEATPGPEPKASEHKPTAESESGEGNIPDNITYTGPTPKKSKYQGMIESITKKNRMALLGILKSRNPTLFHMDPYNNSTLAKDAKPEQPKYKSNEIKLSYQKLFEIYEEFLDQKHFDTESKEEIRYLFYNNLLSFLEFLIKIREVGSLVFNIKKDNGDKFKLYIEPNEKLADRNKITQGIKVEKEDILDFNEITEMKLLKNEQYNSFIQDVCEIATAYVKKNYVDLQKDDIVQDQE